MMGKKTIFDMGRALVRQPREGGIIANSMEVPARPFFEMDNSEITIPLEDIDMTKVEVKMPNPSFVFECNINAIDIESFRAAWDRAVGEAAGEAFGNVTNTTEMLEVPKVRIPLGKNLYSRKLRIRR